jgi:hypothetical protein
VCRRRICNSTFGKNVIFETHNQGKYDYDWNRDLWYIINAATEMLKCLVSSLTLVCVVYNTNVGLKSSQWTIIVIIISK